MYVIKRETHSFSMRAAQYRTVKDFPTFETREAAEAFLKAKKPYGRCIVDVATPKKEVKRSECHCQICGRAILANTGRIAHHGYQRPGQGWQTASCFGAKYRPYEVACDALPKAIAAAEHLRDLTMVDHLRLIYEPPARVDVARSRGRGGYRPEPKYVARPAGFDATEGNPGCYRPDTYESVFWPMVSRHASTVHNINQYIASMQQRLADWRAPTEQAA